MSTALAFTALIELQAALRGGAGASEAIAATCTGGVLDAVAREARLGRPLADIAASRPSGDATADFLVRCLALTERAGGGGAEAVEYALSAIRDDVALSRLLEVRTMQARGTATVLTAVPCVVWVLLVGLDSRMLALYGTPVGWLTGGLAIALAAGSWHWMRRLTRAVSRAAVDADPLTAAAPAPRWRRGAIAGALAGAGAGALLGAVPGVVAAVTAGVLLARPRSAPRSAGGAAEAVALMAVAVETGLSSADAFAEVAAVAPPGAAPLLASAARRVAGGWRCSEVLSDTALADLGNALGASEQWGSPAAPALRALAEDLRAQRRIAVELAAERLQLALIFPTTLLTLPAFVLGIVPPLLWATVRG